MPYYTIRFGIISLVRISAVLTTPLGSLISKMTSQMISPRATTERPRYKSLSMSAGAGVKNSACSSAYSNIASTNHMIEAPQNFQQNIMLFIDADLAEGTLARALVTCTEAKTAAIQELLVPSRYSNGIATGSDTDGTIVVSDAECPE